jgi:hypothetical protein
MPACEAKNIPPVGRVAARDPDVRFLQWKGTNAGARGETHPAANLEFQEFPPFF